MLRKNQNDELIRVINEERENEEKRIFFLKKSLEIFDIHDNDNKKNSDNDNGNNNNNDDNVSNDNDRHDDNDVDNNSNNPVLPTTNNNNVNITTEHEDLQKLFSIERRQASDRIMNLIKFHNENLKNLTSNTLTSHTR